MGLWDLFAKRKPDPDPLPGVGGYDRGTGPAGGEGFPGSTAATRTFKGASPRAAKIHADTDTGFEQGLSGVPQIRQQSARGDLGLDSDSPRATPVTASPQPDLTANMQADPREFFGGFHLRSRLGVNDQPGGELTRQAARIAGAPQNDPRDTTTLWKDAQPVIGQDIPGAQNVRNQVALRYKAAPGGQRTYRSAPRPDQNPATGTTDGGGQWASTTDVTTDARFVFAGGGSQSWAVLREMPYAGRGDGARGGELDGTRYYGTGQAGEFLNAGQGQYGAARLAGPRHRPTVFAEPAPWSSNYYDTTASVGTAGAPGPAGQAPDLVYVSPQAGRASNRTGRTG